MKSDTVQRDEIGVAVQSQLKGVSWTYDLIAQSVRTSEQNLVVVGSNAALANFL